METTRLLLFIALGLVLTMLWQAWQEDYGEEYTLPGGQQAALKNETLANSEDVPSLENIPVTEKPEALNSAVSQRERGSDDQIIRVMTDVFNIEINTLGGTIQGLALLEHPVSKKDPGKPVILLNNKADDFYLLQGGLLSKNETANHKTLFTAEQNSYVMGEQKALIIPLIWHSDKGITVIKTYTFRRGDYLVDIDYQVVNKSSAVWRGRAYGQINRTAPKTGGSKLIYTYTGAVVSSEEKRYEKISFDDIQEQDLAVDIKNGWAAMLQHYFITALLPGSKEEEYRYYTLNPENDSDTIGATPSYVIGAITPFRQIDVGETQGFGHQVYFGPKLQKDLGLIADGLDLTVDYGIFWFIAKPLFWVLDHIHSVTNNWGWSIILVTVLLKLLFYRLSAAGYRSMANMRKVQPRLLSIRERYKEDRPRLNQAMMDLYKKEKINPLGGCFPILIQIPVFISLYWVLLESVELRQADFALWINDLSVPDPYFVLPVLMGITMYVQQKLNPAPMDPVQAKVLSVLPFIFAVFFAFFPSGLVLYWVANNILSIAQQWVITRNLERASPKI